MVRRARIKLSSQEKGICELFRRLGYSLRSPKEDIQSFTSENIDLIKEVEPTYQTGYPSQASLFFAHYKAYFANGGQASIRYAYITPGSNDGKKATKEEIKKVREDLKKYCGLDTEAMILVLNKLKMEVKE